MPPKNENLNDKLIKMFLKHTQTISAKRCGLDKVLGELRRHHYIKPVNHCYYS